MGVGKKVKYVEKKTVESEITEEMEKELFPNGFNKDSLEEEMKSDIFHELFMGELSDYEAEGYIIVDGKVVEQHKERLD